MTPLAAPWIRHDFGITTVDAEYVRPGFASVHLIERSCRVAIIDTGANSSVPLVLRALHQLGLGVEAVDWLFLTHVHLDHAGGAGLLVSHLPHAQVCVHPRGAAHLVDPSRLQAATAAVYGEAAFEQLYGALVPIPQARVRQTQDGERLHLGSSEFIVLHTPGHALHHQVLFDTDASAVFTGDTFGLSYRELDTVAGPFVIPTTTPTQFDPAQLMASIDQIAALTPRAVYLTHYGEITNVADARNALREQIEAFVELARSNAGAANPHRAIRAALSQYLLDRAERHGIARAKADSVLDSDLELNTQGLIAWLARSGKTSSGQ